MTARLLLAAILILLGTPACATEIPPKGLSPESYENGPTGRRPSQSWLSAAGCQYLGPGKIGPQETAFFWVCANGTYIAHPLLLDPSESEPRGGPDDTEI